MTEKEKMLKGMEYNAEQEDLAKERIAVKDLCHEYNNLKPSNIQKRQEIIKKIIGKIHGSFWIEQPFICDYGYNIEVGDNFYSNHNLTVLDANKVKIGNNVFIGPNVSIYTSLHPLEYKLRNEKIESALKIEIGDNVWIGGSVTILPNVRIGGGAVIGAGSVVVKDIEPNSLAVGNPARVIRKINN